MAMKILIIQPWIRLGGAEMVSVHLAYELKQQGHNVSIACTYLDLTGMPDQANHVTYHLPSKGISRWLAQHRLLFYVLGPWVLLTLVWKYSSDVDVLNPHEFPSTWIAVIVGLFKKIPVVWSSYGPTRRFGVKEIARVGFVDWLGWSFASSFIDRILVKRVHAIHVPSEKSRRSIRGRYNCDSTVIPLGVDEPFYSDGNGDRIKRRMKLKDKYVLLCVGKLHPQENQIICLEALKIVLESIPNSFLIVAGSGPMTKRLQRTAKDLNIEQHIKFLGHVPSWEVRDLYKACSIHLYPPVDESWGLTPIEALCARCISVVSNDCGVAEVIEREGIGVVCEPISEAFAKKILEIQKTPDIYQEMSIVGHQYVSDHLRWKNYSQAVLEVMENARKGIEQTSMARRFKGEAKL
jgi:glycosyltransferase involved in cell wall biosynthesis